MHSKALLSRLFGALLLLAAHASLAQTQYSDNFTGTGNQLSWFSVDGACLTAATYATPSAGQIPGCRGNPYYSGTVSGTPSGQYTITVSGSPGWTTNQWVPAGAPYQVRLVQAALLVQSDFVSPEHMAQSVRLSFSDVQQFDDRLQVKNIIFHACKDALSVLQKPETT